MNKLQTAEQAISQLQSGMTIGIGGWGPRRKPMALIREILRSDIKDLTVVAYGGADVGMLCAAGKIKKLVFAFVSLDFIPLEAYFRQARQTGAIKVMEVDEGMMLLGLRAAAWKLPFIPTSVGLGTDVITNSKDIQLVDSPYDNKQWVAMPALPLDVALVHVDRADTRGVCQINGPDHYMDDVFVRAAKQSIVSCEEIVSTEVFHQSVSEVKNVFWERSNTSALVHLPGGAHPSSCAPVYGYDAEHFKRYVASAKQKNGWQTYFSEYIQSGESAYQEKVGGITKINSLAIPTY